MKTIRFIAVACIMVSAAFTGQSIGAETTHKENPKMKQNITELEVIDQVAGTGKEALLGTNVRVHYTGWLYDPGKVGGRGNKFDSSLDRGEPFVFFLGGGQVIRGWDEGVVGMKEGGRRMLIIPSHMAYGSRGAGGVIPPYATLLFEVELLEVQ